MRLLVTGGAGFIGSNFVRKVCDGSLPGITSLLILDKLTYAGVIENITQVMKFPNLEFVRGDICDPIVVNELVSVSDAIINFAAESHVDRSISGAADFVATNVGGVQVLLDAVKNASGRKRFLQISTDEV